MKHKWYVFGFLAMLALILQQPIAASNSVEKRSHCNRKPQSKEKDCHKVKKITKKIEEMQKCQYVIHAKDITKKGFVIDHPGSWCLDGDIEFNPKPSKYAPPDPRAVQAAITIKKGVSNVILNLGNHRITQVGAGTSTQTPFVVGILVPDPNPSNTDPNFVGTESIYIQGDQAIIDGFSMYGIRIFAHIDDIRLNDLTVKNCGLLASKALRPTVNGFEYLPHTNVFTPGFGPSFGVAGIAIGESSILGMGPTFFTDVVPAPNNLNRLSEVVMDNVSCLNNFYMGLMYVNATNTTIDACHFDMTFSDDPGRAIAPAYDVISARGAHFNNSDGVPGSLNTLEDPGILNMTVNNSTFNNTALKGDFTIVPINPSFPVEGMFINRSKNVVFNNCQFNSSSNTFAPPSGVTGGVVLGSNEDTTFINCHFDDVTSLGTINAFHISGVGPDVPTKSSRNTLLINCTANNIQNIGDQQLPMPVLNAANNVTGFAAFYTKDITFEGCISQELVMKAPQENRRSNVVGFLLSATADQRPPLPDATVNNAVYRNCIASRCFALNGGSAVGFSLDTTVTTERDALKSVVLENCVSSGNQTFTPTLTTPGIAQGSGFGFFVLNEDQTTPEEFESFPILFNGCIALHNKGLPSSNTTTAAINPVYSSGFYFWKTVRAALKDCIAEDNVYGFFLNKCDRCTVRNCQADNNVDLIFVPGTGAGFTDVGTAGIPAGTLGTPASPGLSTSVFESNRAFANGANADTGANGNYNVLYGTSLVPLPILTGNLTIPSFPSSTLFQPTVNVSITR